MCNRSTILRVTVVVVEKEIISNSSSKRENPEPPVVEEYEEINLRDIRQQRQV